MENKPSYYSITPAHVRYDDSLKPNEKLLYGEITALANKHGYCWSENKYFAELYGVKKGTVSGWISNLEKNGYVKTKLIYQPNSKQVSQRRIYINDIGYAEKIEQGMLEKSKEELITTSNNNTRVNKEPSSKKVYGEFKNVHLTDKHISLLKNHYPNDYKDRIERLSSYMESKGKTDYKNHYAVIRNWAKSEKSKQTSNKVEDYFD